MRGRKRKLRKLTSENHQFRNLIVTRARCRESAMSESTGCLRSWADASNTKHPFARLIARLSGRERHRSTRPWRRHSEDHLDGYLAKRKAQPEGRGAMSFAPGAALDLVRIWR